MTSIMYGFFDLCSNFLTSCFPTNLEIIEQNIAINTQTPPVEIAQKSSFISHSLSIKHEQKEDFHYQTPPMNTKKYFIIFVNRNNTTATPLVKKITPSLFLEFIITAQKNLNLNSLIYIRDSFGFKNFSISESFQYWDDNQSDKIERIVIEMDVSLDVYQAKLDNKDYAALKPCFTCVKLQISSKDCPEWKDSDVMMLTKEDTNEHIQEESTFYKKTI